MIPGNDDLFWAVMGGSPGNFGILTHVRFRPLHDKDYPDSRLMKILTVYTPEKHRALTALFAEMTRDEELPRNYHYALFTSSPGGPTVEGPKYFEQKKASGMYHDTNPPMQ